MVIEMACKFSAVIKAIRDYFNFFLNANYVLDQTIRKENNILNVSADEQLDLGTYANEAPEPLAIGDINQLILPVNVSTAQTIEQVLTVERAPALPLKMVLIWL